MRNPVRSEADAFRITVAGAGLAGVSVALGALAGEAAGAALFGGGLLGALVWDLVSHETDERGSLEEAAAEGPRRSPTQRRRLLVIANRTLGGEELRELLRRRGPDGVQLHVVAPILASRMHYIASDTDQEREEATERLEAMLAWAAEHGLEATGKVGDPNAALGAIEDELRLHGADEVIISTYPPGRSNWLETGIVERLRDELDVPVTHLTVDLEPVPALAER